MAISRFKLSAFLLSISYACIAFLILTYIDQERFENYVILISCTFIFQILMLKMSRIKLLSFSFFFLFSTYFFSFSYLYLEAFNYKFSGYMERDFALNKYGISAFLGGNSLAFWSMYAIYIGILIANFTCKIPKPEEIKLEIKDNNTMFIIGITMFVLSFPLDLFYIFINQLLAMMHGGYGAVHGFKVNYIILMFTYLLIPSIYLIIVSNKLSKKSSKILLILLLSYKLISMFTGLRAYNLISILVFLYLYSKSVTSFKIKFRYLPLIIISVFFMSNLLISIREMRQTGISFGELVEKLFSNNEVILSFMTEFGSTINIISYVYNISTDPTGGSQLFAGIASIIPGISVIFSNIDFDSMTIVGKYDTWNMGGSYIADFYFDFGYLGIIFSLFYGFIIHKVNNYIDTKILERNYVKIAFLIPILIEIIFTVRSTVGKLPRMIVWYTVIYFFVVYIVKKMRRVNKEYGK
ncbi:O-antigen polysaccharide polymerase Wzy [Bacillus zanthoxyli]|nr:O-antigen polysaccharide polymerase Wzy [Bacillus zanthoxyli]